MARAACYHARVGRVTGRYGQRVQVLVRSRRNAGGPKNALVMFSDGEQVVTSVGCLKWKCDKHGGEA